jgi:hypothetical protein
LSGKRQRATNRTPGTRTGVGTSSPSMMQLDAAQRRKRPADDRRRYPPAAA